MNINPFRLEVLRYQRAYGFTVGALRTLCCASGGMRDRLQKKLILALGVLAISPIVQAQESCASMGVLAGNYSRAAYQLTTEDPDAISQMGFYDAYMMYLSIMFEKSVKEGLHSSDFREIGSSVITLMQTSDKVNKKLPVSNYETIFGRIVVRSCNSICSGKPPASMVAACAGGR